MEETLEDIGNTTNEDELESAESELEKQATEGNEPLEQVVEEEKESQGFILQKKTNSLKLFFLKLIK